MFLSFTGFTLLIWFSGLLHAQSEKQKCDAPRLNGGYFVPKKDSFSDGEVLTYSCESGRKPAVEGWWAKSTCHNGTWSHAPLCISEGACLPPNIPNGSVRANSKGWYDDRRQVVVICNKGYGVNGQSAEIQILCENSQWSSLPVCEKLTNACSEPPKLPNAAIIRGGYQEVFANNAEVTYQCKKGRTTDGTSTTGSIRCSSGTWTEGPECKTDRERACSPPNILHGSVSPNSKGWYNDRSRVEVQCNIGYGVNGQSAQILCENSQWSSLPVCEKLADSCDSPPEILNAAIISEVNQEVFANNAEVTYQCKEGHTTDGKRNTGSIRCSSGTWTKGPECKTDRERACSPPNIPNGSVRGNPKDWYDHRRQVLVKCNKGYGVNGQSAQIQIQCENSQWSSLPVCEKLADSCDNPPEILNAAIISDVNQEVFANNAEVRYECNEGHTTDGKRNTGSIRCSSGTWTKGPECRTDHATDTCSNPPEIPNAAIISDVNQEVFANNAEVTYQCNEGHTTDGKRNTGSIRCSSGTWTEGPECKTEHATDTCRNLPEIPNAVIISDVNQEVFANNAEVTYQCNEGHTTDGSSTTGSIRCSSGTWTEGPECKTEQTGCNLDPAKHKDIDLKDKTTKQPFIEEYLYVQCTQDNHFAYFKCTNGKITVVHSCCHLHLMHGGAC